MRITNCEPPTCYGLLRQLSTERRYSQMLRSIVWFQTGVIAFLFVLIVVYLFFAA